MVGKGGCGGNGGTVSKLFSSGKGAGNIGAGGAGGGGGGITILTSIGGGGGGITFFVVWAINCDTNKLTTKIDIIFFIYKFFA